MTKEVEAYFQEQYAKCGVRVIHIPDFESKEQVDVWIRIIQSFTESENELDDEDDF